MDRFTDSEKDELRKAASSGKLREQFRHIAQNRYEFRTDNGSIDIDRVVKFTADVNALVNHTPKPFRKITGVNFKI